MMGLEKEDLGLSLGLGCAVDRRPLQLGLMPASTSSSSPSYFEPPRPSSWSHILASAAGIFTLSFSGLSEKFGVFIGTEMEFLSVAF